MLQTYAELMVRARVLILDDDQGIRKPLAIRKAPGHPA
jgi:hypothetical protein